MICPVRIEEIASLTAGFRRVTVQGDGLAAYRTVRPADAFTLTIPPGGAGNVRMPRIAPTGVPVWPADRMPLTRGFTVRWFDPATYRLAFDVALHGAGAALTWLGNARPGDRLVLIGMRREFHAGDVDHHLLIGDSSSLPAIASIVERLDVPRTVILQGPPEPSLVKGSDVRWVPSLPDAVRALRRPVGRLQAWMAAEAGVVRAVRPYLVDSLGVSRDDLYTVAYWTAGEAAERGDAVRLAAYHRANEEGLDASDPAVLQTLEFS
jgi:NADPH-dependent ferric siderophore reductase